MSEQKFDESAERELFENRMFNARFMASIVRTGLGGPVEFMSKDCPTKADFVARDEGGHYIEDGLEPSWFAWKKRAIMADEQSRQDAATIAQKADRIAELEESEKAWRDSCATATRHANAASDHIATLEARLKEIESVEAVAWLRFDGDTPDWSEDCIGDTEEQVMRDYRNEFDDDAKELKPSDRYSARKIYLHPPAQPAAQVPDEMPYDDQYPGHWADGWNACRAAMLAKKGNKP